MKNPVDLKKEETPIKNMENIMTVASFLIKATKVAKGMEAGDVLLITSKAIAMGINPIIAIHDVFYVVCGKVQFQTKYLLGLVQKNGHIIRTIEEKPEYITMESERADNKEKSRIIMTLAEAKISSSKVWTAHPRKMLYHAAVRLLINREFADLLSVYEMKNTIMDMENKDFFENEKRLYMQRFQKDEEIDPISNPPENVMEIESQE